ncbi:MAG: methyl-accepting chemotaxis protein [Paracoccus sp. (in: a-proteobacteria)]|uniref:methyl-accepting chemotaxis protein n=1 Tax=Paracoccus sp. TaxID=267 RepID=UPI0026E0EE7D|nr:methyl-accepting chemotaxis protein [Paracoccus sp. (in: a-proteobacteria)]MDO5621592.1 methyl-accepting chemotaxis protein [Paracoccus sp. (in: a-proteobacteria)]
MTERQFIHPDPAQAMAALESSRCVLRFDLTGHILDVNDAYLDLCGYRRDELLGQTISILQDPNDITGSVDSFWAGLRRGEAQQGDFRRINKRGEPFYIQALYTPVRNAAGVVSEVVAFAVDISAAYKIAADATGKVDALTRSQAMIEFTATGEILFANQNFLDAMGYSLEEIKGRHHRMFMDPADAMQPEYEQFWRDLSNGHYQAGEFRRLGKGSREIWIFGSYNPVTDDQGKICKVIKFAQDVTARVRAITEISQGLQAFSRGDLTAKISEQVRGEFAGLRDHFNESITAFRTMVGDIRTTAHSMSGEAGEIAKGASDLARRGESQAASLEQTAAAVEQISGNITMTSQSAQEADNAARDAQQVVLKGAEVVAQAIAAIERIDEHTRQMGEFTRVIESFAFQTNLLSINAAVEAARAGEVGRGFAVVANEVRNLAQQSAKASQNIADLIGKSETEVKIGVKLVRDAGESLDQIRAGVGGMVESIAGIAHATTEQSTGVREVSDALSQLDSVNQANLAMSDEYATAAGSLSQQVKELSAMLGRFHIDAAAETSSNLQRSAA